MICNSSRPNKRGVFSSWAECDLCKGKGPLATAADQSDAGRGAEEEALKDGWLEVEVGPNPTVKRIKNLCQWCAQAVGDADRKADEQPYETPA